MSVRAKEVEIKNEKVIVTCGKCHKIYEIHDEDLVKILRETEYGLYADDFIELSQCPHCKAFNYI